MVNWNWSEPMFVGVPSTVQLINGNATLVAVSTVKEALGLLVTHVWDLVNLPFQDEYPGDRRWNRDAARLAFVPTTDDRKMSHKHWDMIFDHCGAGLNRFSRGSV